MQLAAILKYRGSKASKGCLYHWLLTPPQFLLLCSLFTKRDGQDCTSQGEISNTINKMPQDQYFTRVYDSYCACSLPPPILLSSLFPASPLQRHQQFQLKSHITSHFMKFLPGITFNPYFTSSPSLPKALFIQFFSNLNYFPFNKWLVQQWSTTVRTKVGAPLQSLQDRIKGKFSIRESHLSSIFLSPHYYYTACLWKEGSQGVMNSQRISSLQCLSVKKGMLQRENNLCVRKGLFWNIVWALALQRINESLHLHHQSVETAPKEYHSAQPELPCSLPSGWEPWAGLGTIYNPSSIDTHPRHHTRNWIQKTWILVISKSILKLKKKKAKSQVARNISFLILMEG